MSSSSQDQAGVLGRFAALKDKARSSSQRLKAKASELTSELEKRASLIEDRIVDWGSQVFQGRVPSEIQADQRPLSPSEPSEPSGSVVQDEEQYVTLQVGASVWPGAPRELRTELWLSATVARANSIGQQAFEAYESLLAEEIPDEVEVDIGKDIKRTFPLYRKFCTEEGQQQLSSVLKAYAAHDPEVGYTQGMNFLAGLLLMFLTPQAAFAALVVLMEERELRRYYLRSMSLLQVQLWQLSKLIKPQLNEHMENCGVVPVLYSASWLMTCFSADFPVSFSARILDVMLSDRCDFALLKVAVTILKRTEAALMALPGLEEIMKFLKMGLPSWDEQQLNDIITEAFAKPWTQRQLRVLAETEGAETVAQAMERVHVENELHQRPRGEVEDDDAEPATTSGHSTGIDRRSSASRLGPLGASAALSRCSVDGPLPPAGAPPLPMLPPPPCAGTSCVSVAISLSASLGVALDGDGHRAGGATPARDCSEGGTSSSWSLVERESAGGAAPSCTPSANNCLEQAAVGSTTHSQQPTAADTQGEPLAGGPDECSSAAWVLPQPSPFLQEFARQHSHRHHPPHLPPVRQSSSTAAPSSAPALSTSAAAAATPAVSAAQTCGAEAGSADSDHGLSGPTSSGMVTVGSTLVLLHRRKPSSTGNLMGTDLAGTSLLDASQVQAAAIPGPHSAPASASQGSGVGQEVAAPAPRPSPAEAASAACVGSPCEVGPSCSGDAAADSEVQFASSLLRAMGLVDAFSAAAPAEPRAALATAVLSASQRSVVRSSVGSLSDLRRTSDAALGGSITSVGGGSSFTSGGGTAHALAAALMQRRNELAAAPSPLQAASSAGSWAGEAAAAVAAAAAAAAAAASGAGAVPDEALTGLVEQLVSGLGTSFLSLASRSARHSSDAGERSAKETDALLPKEGDGETPAGGGAAAAPRILSISPELAAEFDALLASGGGSSTQQRSVGPPADLQASDPSSSTQPGVGPPLPVEFSRRLAVDLPAPEHLALDLQRSAALPPGLQTSSSWGTNELPRSGGCTGAQPVEPPTTSQQPSAPLPQAGPGVSKLQPPFKASSSEQGASVLASAAGFAHRYGALSQQGPPRPPQLKGASSDGGMGPVAGVPSAVSTALHLAQSTAAQRPLLGAGSRSLPRAGAMVLGGVALFDPRSILDHSEPAHMGLVSPPCGSASLHSCTSSMSTVGMTPATGLSDGGDEPPAPLAMSLKLPPGTSVLQLVAAADRDAAAAEAAAADRDAAAAEALAVTGGSSSSTSAAAVEGSPSHHQPPSSVAPASPPSPSAAATPAAAAGGGSDALQGLDARCGDAAALSNAALEHPHTVLHATPSKNRISVFASLAAQSPVAVATTACQQQHHQKRSGLDSGACSSWQLSGAYSSYQSASDGGDTSAGISNRQSGSLVQACTAPLSAAHVSVPLGWAAAVAAAHSEAAPSAWGSANSLGTGSL